MFTSYQIRKWDGHFLLEKKQINNFRNMCVIFNTSVVIATAEGILTSINAIVLASNGGGILLSKDWAKSLLIRMGMVKRQVSSKAKVNVEKFDGLKEGFFLDIKNIITLDDIPPELIVNWDQTGINYVPVGS